MNICGNASDGGQPSKLQLYTRLGFGALVGFGMVGSFAGYRQGSTLVFVMTAVGWCLGRILMEAFEAWRLLHPPPPPPPGSNPPPPAPSTFAA